MLEAFVGLAQGVLFVALAVAFLALAWMFARLARIFSTTEESIKEVTEEFMPLLSKTHVTVDNINSQLGRLDEAVGDVAGITDELDQTTTVITRGVRGGVIKVSSATAGLSKGISAFFGGSGNRTGGREEGSATEPEEAPPSAAPRPASRPSPPGSPAEGGR